MKKYKLREQAHISSISVAKLNKNEFVNMEILIKICNALNCNIEYICYFYKEEYDIDEKNN